MVPVGACVLALWRSEVLAVAMLGGGPGAAGAPWVLRGSRPSRPLPGVWPPGALSGIAAPCPSQALVLEF